MVHTGEMKGKSTAAFGLALRGWAQGWSIGVFQFVKSAKWRVGEETAFRALGDARPTGEGGPVEWHKMGEGWSWTRKQGTEDDHAAKAREGWAEIRRRIEAQAHEVYVLDEFTYPIKWGWVDVHEVVDVLARREGRQHVIVTGRDAAPSWWRPRTWSWRRRRSNTPWTRARRGSGGSSGSDAPGTARSRTPTTTTRARPLRSRAWVGAEVVAHPAEARSCAGTSPGPSPPTCLSIRPPRTEAHRRQHRGARPAARAVHRRHRRRAGGRGDPRPVRGLTRG